MLDPTPYVHALAEMIPIISAWLLFLFGALAAASFICLLAYGLVEGAYYVRDRRWRWRQENRDA